MKLADKVAVITGGGIGIGLATALLFAKEGAKVVIAQRTKTTGQEAVAEIKSKGGEAIYVQTDVTKSEQVKNLIDTAVKTFGRIDILYNNAGTLQKMTPIEEMNEKTWDQIYAINVKGIFLGVKYAVPYMKKQGGGVIINTASILGVRPGKLLSGYSSSKAAANMLTKVLALELAEFKIRVNTVNPVATVTKMVRENITKAGIDFEEWEKKRVLTIPIGRLGTPEDAANAALFLASEDSSMLTGTSINLDGGYGI